jgi:serine/threonine-protein kinase HipA
MMDALDCNVFNGDVLVGTLAQRADLTTLFTYDDEYKGPALSRRLPKNGRPIVSAGLPPYFSNLISEGWLEEAQKSLINQNSAPSQFDMLAYFGRDCIGSLRIVPTQELPPTVVKDIHDLGERLADRVHALIPGIQPKVLAIKVPSGDYVVSSRLQDSTHIAKLPHDIKELTRVLENEYVSTLLSQALLPEDKHSKLDLASVVMPSRRESGSDHRISPALLIERFDRDPHGNRIQMYEFNQLLDKDADDKYKGSYKDMADYIRSHAVPNPPDGIRTNVKDVEILFKRILASMLIENGDTHLKNFALLRQGNEFRLSPNYDQVSCAQYKSRKVDFSQMALSIGATRDIFIAQLQPKHVVTLAQEFGLLSPNPTTEQLENLTKLVDDMGAVVKALEPVVNGKKASSGYPEIEKARADEDLSEQLSVIYAAMKKRWNGTFSKVGFFLAKKFTDHAKPTDRDARVAAVSLESDEHKIA